MLPSAAELIARYLRAHGYTETLASFVKEAVLPPEIGTSVDEEPTIESILQEKKTFDLSLNFEKLGTNDDEHRGWTERAPLRPTIINALPDRSNILSVNVLSLAVSAAAGPRPYIVVTTANRQLLLLDPGAPDFDIVRSYSGFQDSPNLDVIAVDSYYLLVASMSGKLTLLDTVTGSYVDQRQDHTKYLVKIAVCSEGNSTIVASAGWDAKVFFYRLDTTANKPCLTPFASLVLPSIPETILFLRSPEDNTPILLVARRESSFLHYYSVDPTAAAGVTLLGQQNLAPHSNAWVAFTPADVQISPADPRIVAVATNSTPHMKLLIVKLLFPHSYIPPSMHVIGPGSGILERDTQASQARAELIMADREEQAILVNANTLAPQTAYSTPRIVWRPDGSGVYVSSDDGIVRGIEAKTGKPVACLEGHEPGSKLRCLWAGHTKTGDTDVYNATETSEYLISGGFDQKLIVWKTPA